MSIRAAAAQAPGCSAHTPRVGPRAAGTAVAVCAALALLAPAARAQAAPESGTEALTAEPWWGTDKALHFAAGAGVAMLGYGLGIWGFDDRLGAAGLGTGLAVGLGATKEGLDAAGLGQPSWKDFTWDVVGAVVGIGLSLTFDAALRGPERH